MNRNAHMTEVYQLVMRMGTFIEDALQKTLHALINQNLSLAREIVEQDHLIDQCRHDIEDACTKIIATRQPMAFHLRELISLIKASTNLERIGDHAHHMAGIIVQVEESTIEQVLPELIEMSEFCIKMVHRVLIDLVNQDEVSAEALAFEDRFLDEMHRNLQSKIIKLMQTSSEMVEDGVQLILFSRFLERLGDHVTNICEWIIYAKKGTHVSLTP
jgi:phosphate transport system protein